MEVRDDALAAEIERILESNTFRNSEALRRLLRFLAEKRLSGVLALSLALVFASI